MKKYIIITDVHLVHGEACDPAYTLVKKVAQKEKFDGVINLGDFLDFEYLSSFVEGMPGATEGSRLAEDMKLLDQELKFWKKYCKESYYLGGNHDETRLSKFLERNPVLKGAIPTVSTLCKENGTEFIPMNKQPFTFLPELYMTHGLSLNKYCFAQNAERAGASVITGHAHRSGTYLYRYPDGRIVNGISLGTLGPLNPDYISGQRIAGWTQTFGVLYVEGNQWQLDNIIINGDYSCIVSGKKYDLENTK